MSETEVLQAMNQKVINIDLVSINSIEQYPIVLYKCNDLYENYSYFYDMNSEQNIKTIQQAKFWSDVKDEYKQPLEHKQLVWAWDNNSICERSICFYSVIINNIFDIIGKNNNTYWKPDNIELYEGEWPEWAKEAYNKLED